ncbi:DUF6294 family protein [Amycolatopsis mediterranei]|uniref:DUF6294 family protein n=1 Tax=Amycolatopsis mediterranei TaxID=33910 RepID=UPI00114CBD7E|nr:DUF6294 family protein [Amycolatopsis mediterranei]UZF71951.1 DUF6294 family protein [Amycolatopsis mediterranei]
MTDEAQSSNGETAETEAVVTSSKLEEVLSASTDELEPEEKSDTAAFQTAEFMWGTPLRSGDCTLSGLINGTLDKGPTLRLHDDGTAELLSRFFSTDDGDAWVVVRLALLDRNRTTLFTFPRFSSPGTVADNQVINWIAELGFPAVFFSSVTGANMTFSC